ncbi:MAG: TIGR03808 family TAT-translocated repetitive protein [Notoacmeibacter sp.]|nr:TIGR03808 family TAT-translocated repetitive protein [Notoacmeibacter sp.]
MLNRRAFLTRSAALAGAAACAVPAQAKSGAKSLFDQIAFRGSIDASEFGLSANALDDQSRVFQKMLEKAALRDTPVFLPPGTYPVSNITLPDRVRLQGVPGATRIVYTGNGHLFAGENSRLVSLDGIDFDGQNRWLSEQVQALIDLRRVSEVSMRECAVTGSGKTAIALEKCGGLVSQSRLSGAQDYALYAVESSGLTITGNRVEDCGNGGILIHRWQDGEDGTLVSGNRVSRMGATRGGTGQYGNGINLFRARGVTVTGNRVSDCAFSAIRANSSSNMIAQGNQCVRSGETALYAEFAFEGAMIAGNIVDGAANGISVVNSNEGGRLATVQGNIVRNLRREGPYAADAPGFGAGITVEADTAVTGNTVEKAPLFGLQLGWGPFLRNVSATGNVMRACGTGIAVSVVEGAGKTVISGNVIDSAKNGGIIGHRWAEAATGELDGEAGAFPHLTVERNAIS